MRIKSGFELREICGEHIIVAHGVENIDFTKVITLNESAADLWNAVIDKDFTAEELAKAFTEMYEVDEQTALNDSERLLQSWIEAGLVEE